MKFPVDLLRQCWFLTGPTACGKTALGLRLAQELDAEILSLDSMAVFCRMDIGTAKPTHDEQRQVPHHLIDLVDPHEEFSTASYLIHARTVAEELVNRGKQPLFVGGTGLYLRAILRGVFEGPPADWDFRTALETQAARHAPNWLHSRLAAVDPVSARRLHPRDVRRLVRALEIHHVTGIPPSRLQHERPLPPEQRPRHVYWLHPPRDWLYERINRRVDRMIAQGLVEEVRGLLDRNPPLGRTARQALGYREIIDWIEGRPATLDEAVTLIQTRTRQFAKRQHTWFRNLEECRELPITGTESVDELTRRLLDG